MRAICITMTQIIDFYELYAPLLACEDGTIEDQG